MSKKTIKTKDQLFAHIDSLQSKTKTVEQREYLSRVKRDIDTKVKQYQNFVYTEKSKVNYYEYLSQYADRAVTLKTRYNSNMYMDVSSPESFMVRYRALVNTKKARGKAPGNVIRDIVSDEAYEISAKQAAAFATYQQKQILIWGKESDYGVTVMRARLGKIPDEFFDALREDRKRLKEVYYQLAKANPANAGKTPNQLWKIANKDVSDALGADWFYIKDK